MTNARNSLPLMFFDKSYIELTPEEKERIDDAIKKWYTFH